MTRPLTGTTNSLLCHEMDLLGMRGRRFWAIDPRMIDPDHRTLVSIASTVASAAYNGKLISPEKVPNTWEDFLKPELKGRKFAVNVRPLNMPSLMAGMGEEGAELCPQDERAGSDLGFGGGPTHGFPIRRGNRSFPDHQLQQLRPRGSERRSRRVSHAKSSSRCRKDP